MSRLTLPPEEMRRIGYRVIDRIVDHLSTVGDRPVGRKGGRLELDRALGDSFPPEDGISFDDVLEQLDATVFSNRMQVDHPRFFAFVPGPGNFVAAMADALTSGLNIFEGSWMSGSGPAAVELKVIEWLCRECGFAPEAGGLFVSGGSMANLTGLAVARRVVLNDRLDDAVVYFSDQTHSSIQRALSVLGFRPEQMRRLTSDDRFRLTIGDLQTMITRDRADGRRPFCVVANAGTTNTGAVDPLVDLATLCAREKLWLHADGAYGAAAIISTRGRAALAGIDRVDSLSLDPHKWLFQPFEAGCILLRDRRLLKDTFRIMPEYLRELHLDSEEVNFCDYGIQLSRSFRALKLWVSMQVFGVRAFREAVEWGFELAEIAERRLRASPVWEVVTPAEMGIVSFRHQGDDSLQETLVERMAADGFALLTSTALRGRRVLRLCTINPRTTGQDMADTISRLEELAI